MKLNHTDNGNGQMAIIDENLRCVAFIPKLYPESDKYIKLFENAPEMLDMVLEFLESIKNEDIIIKDNTDNDGFEARGFYFYNKFNSLIKKSTE